MPARGDAPAPEARRTWRAYVCTPWFAAAVGGICFLNTLGNGFALDDVAIVQTNPRIRSLTNVRDIWLSDWWQPQTELELIANRFRDRLYRPLAMQTFALNYALGGLDETGYHAVNVLLHMTACALLWHLVQRMFGDRGVSAAAALLFAVHPIHVEAVANVIGRAEVLGAVFILAGLLVLLPERRLAGWARAAAGAPLFAAAAFSKETAVCYPAVALVALHHHATRSLGRRPTGRWWVMQAAALAVPLLVYFPMRYQALEGHVIRDREVEPISNPLSGAPPVQRAGMAVNVVGNYVRLLLAPSRLSSYYGLGVTDDVTRYGLKTLLGVAGIAGVLVALGGYRSRNATWQRCAPLAAMAVASYALVSNTVLLIGVDLAERLMYWPSAPLLALIAVACVATYRAWTAPGRSGARHASGALAVGWAFLGVLGLRSVVRNVDWADTHALMSADVATNPQGVAHNLGMARVLIRGRTPEAGREAVPYIERALAVEPNNPVAHALLGRAYALAGDRERAIRYLDSAVRFDPGNVAARALLTALQADLGQTLARIESLRAAAASRPADPTIQIELGRLLREVGRQPESLEAFRAAAEGAPTDPEALYLYGEALALNNEPERAREVFLRVVELNPDDWRAHGNLSVYLSATDPAASLEHARAAHRLRPDAFETNVNLAEALALNGLRAEAIEQYARIERGLSPDDPQRALIVSRRRELESQRP